MFHFFQMLRYMDDPQMLRSTGYKSQVVTKIIIKETDVHHSGSYQCEPGASPSAQVNVHVLDGKFNNKRQFEFFLRHPNLSV